jgi:hypothetical protein
MKIFFIKCFLLIPVVCALLLAINLLYINTVAWQNEYDIEKFSHIPENIQIANFGSSHGFYGFEWTDIQYTTFNFALAAQRHLFDYALLRQYTNHFEKNAVAIILIEYFEITKTIKEFQDQMPRYYRILERQYIPKSEYIFTDYVRYSVFPVLSAGNNLISIVHDVNPEDVLIEKWHTSMSSQSQEWILSNANGWYNDWINNSDGDAGYQYNKEILIELIDYCLSHNIQPVLVSTPIASTLNTVFEENSPDFLKRSTPSFIACLRM